MQQAKKKINEWIWKIRGGILKNVQEKYITAYEIQLRRLEGHQWIGISLYNN